MDNKRNVVVMFLLIMLSFAIISEVSAASDAEADGTGQNPSVMPVGMCRHDAASERYDGNMLYHADFQSHNEQKSFDRAPTDVGGNVSDENLYKQYVDSRPMENAEDLNRSGESESDGIGPFGLKRPMANASEPMIGDMHMGDVNEFSYDWGNGSFNDACKDGKLMDDVVSKLIGMNNIAPNVKSDDGKHSPSKKKDAGDMDNASLLKASDANIPSDEWPVEISKNKIPPKPDGKSPKKVKSNKKPKRILPKRFKGEMAKS